MLPVLNLNEFLSTIVKESDYELLAFSKSFAKIETLEVDVNVLRNNGHFVVQNNSLCLCGKRRRRQTF